VERNLFLKNLEDNHHFKLPNIIIDKVGEVEVSKTNSRIALSVNGVNWMGLNLLDYREVYEFLSHILISKGRVLCSGMGLLLRESWLLNKGFDITLVEHNIDLINYHKFHNSDICSKIKIIHDDIHNVLGDFDTVLLDHYEHETQDEIISDVKKILKNIKCNTLWFWPLERLIMNHHHRKSGGWEFYQHLRTKIPNLPNLTKDKLFEFIDSYYYHRSENFLPNK
jgi:hypothetical protein